MLKTSNAPHVLNVFQALTPRMELSPTQLGQYHNLKKGYEGEKKLNASLETNLSSNYPRLTNLLLENNQTEFQIDTLLIGRQAIYPLEVKNYENSFYIQDDNWYAASSGKEIRNPLHQLKRTELLLQNLLQFTGMDFAIEPYLVFVNPSFYLYQAPLNIPAIFPNQINRFINKLNTMPFEQTKSHKKLIHYLNDHRLISSKHEHLPEYKYNDLKKGIVCVHCNKLVSPANNNKLYCRNCDHEEKMEPAVKRSIVEFTTLFPNEKITTQTMLDWCAIVPSKKMIRRILKENLHLAKKGQHAYYTFKK